MRKIILIMTILSAVLLIGCASILTGTRQNVMIKSQPQGAQVTVNGFTGVTPCTADLKKGKTYQILATKDGYEPAASSIGKKFNPMFLGNILIGGLLGMIIDGITGAWMDLDKSDVFIPLTPRETTPPKTKTEP